MYSPKRRFRLFRDPAFTPGGGGDAIVYTYSWAEQLSAPAQRYATIAMDDTGDVAISTRWTSIDGAEGPYISTDRGATWTRKVSGMVFGASSSTNSPCVARSNPSVMYAPVSSSGYLYKSTDTGDSWTELTSAGARSWNSISCDSTGSNVVASAASTNLYKSTDGGSTWTVLSNSGTYTNWEQTFISEGGTVIAGIVFGTNVVVSTDGGSTFTSNTSYGGKPWRGLSGSSDGSVLFASYVGATGGAALSTDSGATWTDVTASVGGAGTYWNTGVSLTGNKLVTARDTGSVYVSQDKGVTWEEQLEPGSNKSWEGIGISSDGKTIIVGRNTGRPWVATGTA